MTILGDQPERIQPATPQKSAPTKPTAVPSPSLHPAATKLPAKLDPNEPQIAPLGIEDLVEPEDILEGSWGLVEEAEEAAAYGLEPAKKSSLVKELQAAAKAVAAAKQKAPSEELDFVEKSLKEAIESLTPKKPESRTTAAAVAAKAAPGAHVSQSISPTVMGVKPQPTKTGKPTPPQMPAAVAKMFGATQASPAKTSTVPPTKKTPPPLPQTSSQKPSAASVKRPFPPIPQ